MLNKPASPFVWCNEVLKCLSTECSNSQASGWCPLQSPGALLAWPDCENKLQMTKCNCNFQSRNQTRHNKPQSSRLTCHNSWVWNSSVKVLTVLTCLHGAFHVKDQIWKAADKPLLITKLQLVVNRKYIYPNPQKTLSVPPNPKQCRDMPMFLNTQVIEIHTPLKALH